MKKYINPIGYLIVSLSIIFIFFKLITNFRSIPSFNWGISSGLTLFSAVIFSASTVVTGSFVWALLLSCGGLHLNFRRAFIIYGLSQISKYFPGNIFQYLGRIVLGRKTGLTTETVVFSMGVETLIMSVTAALIGFLGLFIDNKWILYVILNKQSYYLKVVLFILTILAISLIISVAFFPNLKNWIRSRAVYFNIKILGLSTLLYAVVFVIYGIFISLLMNIMWEVNSHFEWYQFIWGFAIAWILGFITPGAPGGLGVREIVFFELYAHEFGQGVIIGLVLVIRVFTSMGDILAFIVAFLLNRKQNIFQGAETWAK